MSGYSLGVSVVGLGLLGFAAGCACASEGGVRTPDGGLDASTDRLVFPDLIQSDRPPTEGGDGGNCGAFTVVLRDFREDHPDFEQLMYSSRDGLVETMLGADRRPVYSGNNMAGGITVITSQETFDQWYRDVDGVNQRFVESLTFTREGELLVYDNSSFFPLNDRGFGNENNWANFHFTTEFHGDFVYRGGETFTFTGDDDLWVFVNNRLAIDLGGVHAMLSETITFDDRAAELGITAGNTYPMDIFHAERHRNASNFRIATNIECFESEIIN